MILSVAPLPVGNALRLLLDPPQGAVEWTVLRKGTASFAAFPDPDAVVVYRGADRAVVDACGLVNGAAVFYQVAYWDGSTWGSFDAASGTPATSYEDRSTDAMSVVRDRIEAGIANEVAAGALSPASGSIAVLNAPPAYDDTRWPLVTVHLVSEQPVERVLGESFEAESFDPVAGNWIEGEGWLARVQLAVIGWSQNPDERIALRQVLRRLVVANLPVFDAAGMIQIEFSQHDVDFVGGEYPANVYQSAGTLGCLAPISIGDRLDPITDVQVTATASN